MNAAWSPIRAITSKPRTPDQNASARSMSDTLRWTWPMSTRGSSAMPGPYAALDLLVAVGEARIAVVPRVARVPVEGGVHAGGRDCQGDCGNCCEFAHGLHLLPF